MITIRLTYDTVENEPGPNMHWRGSTADYKRLLSDLHHLGMSSGGLIILGSLSYAHVHGGYTVKAASAAGGSCLLCVQEDVIEIVLDPEIWRSFLHHILSISFNPSFTYVEFDDLNLQEDANIIMTSE